MAGFIKNEIKTEYLWLGQGLSGLLWDLSVPCKHVCMLLKTAEYLSLWDMEGEEHEGMCLLSMLQPLHARPLCG